MLRLRSTFARLPPWRAVASRGRALSAAAGDGSASERKKFYVLPMFPYPSGWRRVCGRLCARTRWW
jgi:hypothetical protein